MSRQTGIGGLANVISQGLTSYRDTKRDVEDRDYLLEQRGLQKQRGDTAYAQQQTVFAQGQNDRAIQDQERAMAEQIKNADVIFTATGGKDPSLMESAINTYGKQYGFGRQVAIQPQPDGNYKFREYDDRGEIVSDEIKDRKFLDGIAQIMSFGPQKVREMQAAKEARQAEQSQSQQNEYAKNEVKYSQDVNLEALKSQNRIKEEQAKERAGKTGDYKVGGGVLYNERTGKIMERGLASSDAKPLTEAQKRTNAAVENARILVKKNATNKQEWLENITQDGIEMPNPHYSPQIAESVKIARQEKFGEDEQATDYAINQPPVKSSQQKPAQGLQPRPAVAQAVQTQPAQTPKESLPQQAASQLKNGAVTTFANGQAWTLRDGQPVRVK